MKTKKDIEELIKQLKAKDLFKLAVEANNETLYLEFIHKESGLDVLSGQLGLDDEFKKYMESYKNVGNNEERVELIRDFELLILQKICFPDFD